MHKPTLIAPKMTLLFPHILALVEAMPSQGSGLDIVSALRLQGIAVKWFRALDAVPSFICPCCGSLWSSADLQASCTHTTRYGEPIPEVASPEQETVIRRWLDIAKEDALYA
jgi:hypothetical protein